jgi:hypothetical protein
MGSPVHWGDVPTWISAVTGTAGGVAAVFRILSKRQEAQAGTFFTMLDELADLESEDVRHLVEDNPVVAEILGRAAEEAARTASDHKRYLLAQVAAAALRGDATPGQINALLYLERTVIALDPADLTLLVVIGTTSEGKPRLEGEQVSRAEMQARWPSPPDLLDPALAMLEQQGLIEGVSVYDGGTSTYRLRPYSQQFLRHLLTDLGGWPPHRQLESQGGWAGRPARSGSATRRAPSRGRRSGRPTATRGCARSVRRCR